MSRMSAYVVVALTGAFAVSAHAAETRSVSWQGQAIEASIGEPTRGIGPTQEELQTMVREAVPVTTTRALSGESQTGK
ncbi:MAG TPA: hypothetical protein VF886_13755 [Roseiarcus sp.]|jgi:hypothetical protein